MHILLKLGKMTRAIAITLIMVTGFVSTSVNIVPRSDAATSKVRYIGDAKLFIKKDATHEDALDNSYHEKALLLLESWNDIYQHLESCERFAKDHGLSVHSNPRMVYHKTHGSATRKARKPYLGFRLFMNS